MNPTYTQQVSLITSPFEQYAHAYLLIYEQQNIPSEKNMTLLVKAYQKSLLNQMNSQNIITVIASSSNVINNALRTLNNNNKSIMLAELRHLLKKILQPTSTGLRAKL